MRLFEAIINANQRALQADQNAGIHPGDFHDALPVAGLTCIDPRLNPLFPGVLGLPADQFIWLRNAGNIITTPTSSTMRFLALACVVKGAKEIAIIGHTDCLVAKTSVMQLIERLHLLGIERHSLPDNLTEYFGLFGSERQNVIKGVELARHSPVIGPAIPIHGLLVNVMTGGLEWLVNGYETSALSVQMQGKANSGGHMLDTQNSLSNFNIGEMKFPDGKIGEQIVRGKNWLEENAAQMEVDAVKKDPDPKADVPPKIPLPRPVRPKVHLRKAPPR